MQEMLTPDEIEKTSFPDGEFGYDQLHVDAFVRTIADEVRRLQRDLELAIERGAAPYRAAGKEIGDLIQNAKERAAELVNDAEDSAARIVKSARAEADTRRKEAVDAEREALQTRDRVVAEGRAEAAALVERARRVKAHAEAESRIVLQEAEREARRLKQEAQNEADGARTAAEQRYREVSERLERRIRALQEAEATLARRVASLKAEYDAAAGETSGGEVDVGTPEPETT